MQTPSLVNGPSTFTYMRRWTLEALSKPKHSNELFFSLISQSGRVCLACVMLEKSHQWPSQSRMLTSTCKQIYHYHQDSALSSFNIDGHVLRLGRFPAACQGWSPRTWPIHPMSSCGNLPSFSTTCRGHTLINKCGAPLFPDPLAAFNVYPGSPGLLCPSPAGRLLAFGNSLRVNWQE